MRFFGCGAIAQGERLAETHVDEESVKFVGKGTIAKKKGDAYSAKYEAEPPEERANVLLQNVLCAGVFWHGRLSS